ncbi:cell wall-active antibiotics response protein LiaF [Cohnella faecalis]|nr:cell wall-active antibiotics response protein LiaF [Cohnella faecalis]
MKFTNNALLFIAAGLYLAVGNLTGYSTVNAVLLLLIGIDRFRLDRSKLSILLIAVSTIALIISQFALFAVIILVSLGIYYFRTRPHVVGESSPGNNHKLFLNLRLDEQSWVLQSLSCWHAVGEVRMDMSRAVPEARETVLILQGLVGDLDLAVPEDYGLQIEASVLIGKIGRGSTKDGGVLQRVSWRSPDYDEREHQLKLQLFYLVGDIKIRTV